MVLRAQPWGPERIGSVRRSPSLCWRRVPYFVRPRPCATHRLLACAMARPSFSVVVVWTVPSLAQLQVPPAASLRQAVLHAATTPLRWPAPVRHGPSPQMSVWPEAVRACARRARRRAPGWRHCSARSASVAFSCRCPQTVQMCSISGVPCRQVRVRPPAMPDLLRRVPAPAPRHAARPRPVPDSVRSAAAGDTAPPARLRRAVFRRALVGLAVAIG